MFYCSLENSIIPVDQEVELLMRHTQNAACRSRDSNEVQNSFLKQRLWFPITMTSESSNRVSLQYLYVAENGVAVLTNSTLPLETGASLQNPSFMLQFRFLSDFKVVIAPLWMRSTLSHSDQQSRVCVENFNSLAPDGHDLSSINKLVKTRLGINFNTIAVTVASWKNIVPKWSNQNQSEFSNARRESLSFQIAIATDYNSIYLLSAYGEMKVFGRFSQEEYIHAMGPAVFNGTIQKLEEPLITSS